MKYSEKPKEPPPVANNYLRRVMKKISNYYTFSSIPAISNIYNCKFFFRICPCLKNFNIPIRLPFHLAF